jgi:hypothetical protein
MEFESVYVLLLPQSMLINPAGSDIDPDVNEACLRPVSIRPTIGTSPCVRVKAAQVVLVQLPV